MTQPYPQQAQIKVRTSVLVFLKGSTAPLVLYVDNASELYDDLSQALKTSSASAKLIEIDTQGPIKKVAFFLNQIGAVAMQDEQYVQ